MADPNAWDDVRAQEHAWLRAEHARRYLQPPPRGGVVGCTAATDRSVGKQEPRRHPAQLPDMKYSGPGSDGASHEATSPPRPASATAATAASGRRGSVSPSSASGTGGGAAGASSTMGGSATPRSPAGTHATTPSAANGGGAFEALTYEDWAAQEAAGAPAAGKKKKKVSLFKRLWGKCERACAAWAAHGAPVGLPQHSASVAKPPGTHAGAGDPGAAPGRGTPAVAPWNLSCGCLPLHVTAPSLPLYPQSHPHVLPPLLARIPTHHARTPQQGNKLSSSQGRQRPRRPRLPTRNRCRAPRCRGPTRRRRRQPQ
jgi:hypothetical protein